MIFLSLSLTLERLTLPYHTSLLVLLYCKVLTASHLEFHLEL